MSSYGASDAIKEEMSFCVRWLVTVSMANTNKAELKFCQVSSYSDSDAMKEEVRFCVRCLVMVPLL